MAQAHDHRVSRRPRHREAKNATFLLPCHLIDQMEAAVSSGAVPNKTALVEQALAHELAAIHRQSRRVLLDEAMRDPLFLRDLAEVERDFAHSDAESALEIV